MITEIERSRGLDEISQLGCTAVILRMIQKDLNGLVLLPLDRIHPIAEFLKLLASALFLCPAKALSL